MLHSPTSLKSHWATIIVLLNLSAQILLQFFQGIPSVLQIKLFDFRSRPRGFPQELQAGLYARVIIKASYIDDLPHFLPSMMLHQLSKHYFQRDTVKRIFMLLVAHVPLFFKRPPSAALRGSAAARRSTHANRAPSGRAIRSTHGVKSF